MRINWIATWYFKVIVTFLKEFAAFFLLQGINQYEIAARVNYFKENTHFKETQIYDGFDLPFRVWSQMRYQPMAQIARLRVRVDEDLETFLISSHGIVLDTFSLLLFFLNKWWCGNFMTCLSCYLVYSNSLINCSTKFIYLINGQIGTNPIRPN